jgi:hypothetical protein
MNKILTGALIGITSIAYAQNNDNKKTESNNGGPRYKKDLINIKIDTNRHRPRYSKSNDWTLDTIAESKTDSSKIIEMDLNSDGLVDRIIPMQTKTAYMFKQKDGSYKVEFQDHTPVKMQAKDSLNLEKKVYTGKPTKKN